MQNLSIYCPLIRESLIIQFFEHLKITSAINTYLNQDNPKQDNSLLFFAMGGVQNFISQARKTQDLFMGSFMFSYLTFIGIKKIIENYGPTSIIYPELYGQPLFDWYLKNTNLIIQNSTITNSIMFPTIPNKFVCILPTSDEKQIHNLTNEIIKAITEEWKNAVNVVLAKFELNKINQIVNQIDNQVSDFPQIFWIALPWRIQNQDLTIQNLKDLIDESEFQKWENLWKFASNPNIGLIYQLFYSTGEKLMGARKKFRNFEQNLPNQIAFDKKCNLCGERDGLIKAETAHLKVGKFINKKEKLCIPCFTRRAFEKYLIEKNMNLFENFSFPSLAEIASADFKAKAIEIAKTEFEEYVKTLSEITKTKTLNKLKDKISINFEGEWFFEENLTIKK